MNEGTATESCWSGDRGARVLEPAVEPDVLFDDSDEQDTKDDLAACGEVMRAIFDYCFQPREAGGRLPELDAAFRRFCCVAWLLRPELLNDVSLCELAPHLGVTRAALSKAIRKFGDARGIRNHLQKREGTRAVYSAVQKRDHWRNRDKTKPAASCETTGSAHERISNVKDSP